jgi:hypothetical protein
MMAAREPEISEGCGVGSQLVCYDRARSETALLEQLSHKLERGALITPGLDEDIQDLPVLVDARHRYMGFPPIETNISSRCHWECGRGR